MRRVAAAVGITPMAVYRHYANRDGLLNTLADAGFVELTAKLEGLRLRGGIDRQLLKILDVFLDHAFDNPRLFELMFLKKREGARQYPEDFRARRVADGECVGRCDCARDGNGLPEQRRCVGDRLRDGRVDAGPHHALPGRTHGDVAFGVPRLLP